MEPIFSAEQGGDIVALMDELSTRPALFLCAEPRVTGPYDSKIGGCPYLPPDFAYPGHAKRGDPLAFLAQLNFARLPKLPDFPDKGILQFYIGNEDSWGLDHSAPTEQKGFRVVYHEALCEDASSLQLPPAEPRPAGRLAFLWKMIRHFSRSDYRPFTEAFALEGYLEDMPIDEGDYRYDDVRDRALKTLFATSNTPLKTLRDGFDVYKEAIQEQSGNIFDLRAEKAWNHLAGGYPSFTQDDVRWNEWPDHTVLLFQVVSETYKKEGRLCEIMWGDMGVANFFITPEALRRRDFSNVLYNWDCH